MSNYQAGKIYKLIDNTIDNNEYDTYIGSTSQSLTSRLDGHIFDYNRYLRGEYGYASAFDIIENKDYKIILLEEYPCKSNKELLVKT